jgi:hypothetical protein
MALLERVEQREGGESALDPAAAWMARDAAFRDELDDPAVFAAHVQSLGAIVRELDIDAVAGVSTVGRRLAFAISREVGVSAWAGERGTGSLLLVDGLVNTGVQLMLGLRSALEAGVSIVAGAAVRADRDALARLKETGVEIRALQLV